MLDYLTDTLVVPPGCCVVLVVVGALLALRWRRVGRAVLAVGAVSLWPFCTPFVGSALLRSLQTAPALSLADPPPADAIVVLAAGFDRDSPEFGGITVGPLSLQRLRYAARVQHATGRPLLVSGGPIPQVDVTHAVLMQGVLERELDTPVQWLEMHSKDTWQNAEDSAAILREAGIRRIYLVTHAWHMPRARWCFERQGLTVVPAPTAFAAAPEDLLGGLTPRWTALRDSAWAMHEYVGALWYHLVH